jgi:hypothetical protein
MTTGPDFICTLHGMNLITLQPNSARAKIWAEEHLPADAERFGGWAISTSSAQPVIDGIGAAGLTIMVQGV